MLKEEELPWARLKTTERPHYWGSPQRAGANHVLFVKAMCGLERTVFELESCDKPWSFHNSCGSCWHSLELKE